MASDTSFLNQKGKEGSFFKPAGIASLAVVMCLFFAISHLYFDKGEVKIKEDDISIYYNFLFYRSIDLNSATMQELVELPGIGVKSAEKILAYRQRLGFYLCMEELYGPESPLNPKQIRTLFMYATIR